MPVAQCALYSDMMHIQLRILQTWETERREKEVIPEGMSKLVSDVDRVQCGFGVGA